MSENLVISDSRSGQTISEEAIREGLSRILESPMFIQSDRLSRFLRFTVEATLAGEADTLEEYLIGTEVYDRKPPYHPSADSIVRSEARRLRNKLREYYESVGKDDSVFIYYRPGSYVPTFRHQRSLHDDRIATDRALGELFTEEVGRASPWAAPIGTGQGPRNAPALRELRQRAPHIPLIIDAGIGLPSHACQVMEWGFDGVLLNTAVSRALDPVRMAGAFAQAVRAGRSAFLGGPMTVQEMAVSSTPEIGRPFASDCSSQLPPAA